METMTKTLIPFDRARDGAAILDAANRFEARQPLFSRLVEQSDDSVMITDCNGRVEYVNPAFVASSGFSAKEMQHLKPDVLKSGAHEDGFYRRLWATLLAGNSFRADFINRRKDGELFHEDKTITPLRNQQGVVTHFAAVGRDIGERVKAQRRIRRLAYYDNLTGLPNRILLVDRLNHALKRLRRGPGLLAIMFLDLDRFKAINDNFGHAVGDRVIKSVATRLRRCIRESDSIARLGGDEFVVVLEDVASKREIAATAEKLLLSLADDYMFDGQYLNTTASIGIALAPYDGTRVNLLLKNADHAMYRSKAEGGCCYTFFAGV